MASVSLPVVASDDPVAALREAAPLVRAHAAKTTALLSRDHTIHIDANGLLTPDQNGYIRMVATRGVGLLGISPRRAWKPTVYIIADTLDERDETFSIRLTDATNATFGRPTATVKIIDDDGPVITVDEARTIGDALARAVNSGS